MEGYTPCSLQWGTDGIYDEVVTVSRWPLTAPRNDKQRSHARYIICNSFHYYYHPPMPIILTREMIEMTCEMATELSSPAFGPIAGSCDHIRPPSLSARSQILLRPAFISNPPLFPLPPNVRIAGNTRCISDRPAKAPQFCGAFSCITISAMFASFLRATPPLYSPDSFPFSLQSILPVVHHCENARSQAH
jgi:hypothetical protein